MLEAETEKSEPPRDLEASRIEVDAAALRGNLTALRSQAGPNRQIIAVVKADGYGHGAVCVARALAGCDVDFFAAGSLSEAIAVRAAAPQPPILILGAMLPAESRSVIEHGLIATLDHAGAARALSEAAGNTGARVFVKIDGGFGRFGVQLAEAAEFIRWLAALPGLAIAGVYTHLPFSDAAGRSWAERQVRGFDEIVATVRREGIAIPVVQSLASPGLATALPDQGNAVAAGHLLYGMAPVSAGLDAEFAAYRPALRAVKTTLLHIGRRLPGDSAAPYLRGSGGGLLGVMPVGIHHGYRPTHPQAHVVIHGARAPVLRACLENTVLDLSANPHAEVGDDVLVAGGAGTARITLADLAEWQAASPLAVLTGLGRALPRRLV